MYCTIFCEWIQSQRNAKRLVCVIINMFVCCTIQIIGLFFDIWNLFKNVWKLGDLISNCIIKKINKIHWRGNNLCIPSKTIQINTTMINIYNVKCLKRHDQQPSLVKPSASHRRHIVWSCASCAITPNCT